MANTVKRRRPALILLVLAAFATCLLLGYWQLQRFESSSGTGQNLGYALQWPLFAGFVVFFYRRFVQLEDADEDEPAVSADEPKAIPDGILPERPSFANYVDSDDDPESRQLLEYNTYLADLNRESDRSTT
ncbi:transcriptional regulator [Actinomycetes bacterium M1A6_2h]